jgi:hypothetical protein
VLPRIFGVSSDKRSRDGLLFVLVDLGVLDFLAGVFLEVGVLGVLRLLAGIFNSFPAVLGGDTGVLAWPSSARSISCHLSGKPFAKRSTRALENSALAKEALSIVLRL